MDKICRLSVLCHWFFWFVVPRIHRKLPTEAWSLSCSFSLPPNQPCFFHALMPWSLIPFLCFSLFKSAEILGHLSCGVLLIMCSVSPSRGKNTFCLGIFLFILNASLKDIVCKFLLMWKGNIWAPSLCCWCVELFLIFVLHSFFLCLWIWGARLTAL